MTRVGVCHRERSRPVHRHVPRGPRLWGAVARQCFETKSNPVRRWVGVLWSKLQMLLRYEVDWPEGNGVIVQAHDLEVTYTNETPPFSIVAVTPLPPSCLRPFRFRSR